MKFSFSFLVILACLVGACEKDVGPAIAITDVRILSPMPGTRMGVAYMTISNDTRRSISIESARSPQFDRVEMHETSIEDDVSRMRELDSVNIPGGGSVSFEAGGKHFMLKGARPDTNAGSPVTIELVHSGGLLVVSATMHARQPAQ